MTLTFYERALQPHVVYRFFDKDGLLLYVGCSRKLFHRLANHGTTKEWAREIATASFEWFGTWSEATRAEAQAIKDETPKYNQVGNLNRLEGPKHAKLRRPRGDGIKCPRCGSNKELQKQTYCRACMREYQRERRARTE